MSHIFILLNNEYITLVIMTLFVKIFFNDLQN